MPYVTNTEFEQAFGQSEANELLESGHDFAKVEAASASLIDGYLAAKYPLPLTSTPSILKGWALDITRYRLWDDAAPEEVRRRYEDALAQLKLLAQGVIALPPDAAGAPAAGPSEMDGYSNERVFTECSLKDF